jgi:hypothetical protein
MHQRGADSLAGRGDGGAKAGKAAANHHQIKVMFNRFHIL